MSNEKKTSMRVYLEFKDGSFGHISEVLHQPGVGVNLMKGKRWPDMWVNLTPGDRRLARRYARILAAEAAKAQGMCPKCRRPGEIAAVRTEAGLGVVMCCFQDSVTWDFDPLRFQPSLVGGVLEHATTAIHPNFLVDFHFRHVEPLYQVKSAPAGAGPQLVK